MGSCFPIIGWPPSVQPPCNPCNPSNPSNPSNLATPFSPKPWKGLPYTMNPTTRNPKPYAPARLINRAVVGVQ